MACYVGHRYIKQSSMTTKIGNYEWNLRGNHSSLRKFTKASIFKIFQAVYFQFQYVLSRHFLCLKAVRIQYGIWLGWTVLNSFTFSLIVKVISSNWTALYKWRVIMNFCLLKYPSACLLGHGRVLGHLRYINP